MEHQRHSVRRRHSACAAVLAAALFASGVEWIDAGISGYEDWPADGSDSVVRSVEFSEVGFHAALSDDAAMAASGVSFSFAAPPAGVVVSRVTAGGAEVAPENGVYTVAAGVEVTVEFAAAPGMVLAAGGSSRTYTLFEDGEIGIDRMPAAASVSSIQINEVMASNGDTAHTANGGAELDWVELRNDSGVDIDVAGWYMYDSPDKPAKWAAIEGSCIVPAHGFMVVWCDKSYSDWADGEAHAKFGVGKSDSTVVLATAQDKGAIVAQMALPPQMKDVSYGRGSRERTLLGRMAPAEWRVADGDWQPAVGTVGMPGQTNGFRITSYKFDDTTAPATLAAVEGAIASGRFPPVKTVYEDYVAYSNANKSVKTSPEFAPYYRHVGTMGTSETKITGSYYAFLSEGVIYIPRAGSWTFSVGSDDGFSLDIWNERQSFHSEFSGGRSYGQTPGIFRVQEPGAYNVRLLYFQGTGSAALDFSVREGEFDYEDFTLDGFRLVGLPESEVTHAGAWAGCVSTDVFGAMLGASDALEWRTTLTLGEAPAPGDSYRLKVRYADGFAARVNGTVVASILADGQRPLADALVPAVFDIPAGLLAAGGNLIEVTAFNDDASSAEFLVSVEVAAKRAEEEFAFFREATPGAENTTAGYGPASPKVSFSVPHGFKTEAFDVALTCADEPSAAIYYTLDGTSPTTASALYAGPIRVSATTCIRAAVPREGSVVQQDASATYLFLDDILRQTRGVVPDGFPANKAVNSQVMTYGMDQSVVNGADRDRLLRGFTNSVATLSLVIDPANLFNSQTGIYVNAQACDGRPWERLTMVEQIDPRDAANGFSSAAGLRIRGAFSRKPSCPKHSLRLFFRNDYGDGPLEFPLFGDEGAGKFKKVDLRTSQNFAWANGYATDTFIHEVFSRDTQRDMGDLYTRSRYYNLFINGQYWGLYQTQERGDEDFAETYNGGDADMYDVIKTSQPGYVTGASEGTIDAWEGLWDIAVNEGFSGEYADNYRRAMGLNPDGTRNPEYPVYLNPTNLMDYMICSHFVVDSDTPASTGSHMANNLYAIRDRDDGDEGLKSRGFYYLRHDAEHSMGENTDRSKYSDDPTPYGTELRSAEFKKLSTFNPAELHYRLCFNDEYRKAFADRFYRHCLREGGALTVEKATERFASRMAEIDDVIVCEAARWATKGQTRQTWLNTCGNCLSFITNRMPYMVSQYRARGWYPNIDAPLAVDSSGAAVESGVELPVGSKVYLSVADAALGICYTTDGSDPQSASTTALYAGEAIDVPEGGLELRARALSEATGEWSAMEAVSLVVAQPTDQMLGVRVAAVYSSTADGGGDGAEFIVLTNMLGRAVSLEACASPAPRRATPCPR